MTQPDPYAGQRAAALEVYTQYEQQLYDGYLAMMGAWLTEVGQQVLSASVTSLALMPDPYAVFAGTPAWAGLVDVYTEQVVRDVLAPIYERTLGPDVLFSTRPFVQNFIASMRNNLTGLPDRTFALVGDIIHNATVNGASIPDVQEQIRQLFQATGADSTWAAKARTVAVTTLHTAYAGGQHDAYSALIEADPETKWVHRWLATDDARTRPTHVAADGQVQPWGVAFTVGGAQLMHPGAPGGPPEEVINCRCVELLEVEGEPTPMDNRQSKTLAAAAAEYSHAYCTLTACKQTGKPGLCKGQHRGDFEPGSDQQIRQGGDQGAIDKANIASQQIKAVADRIRQSMANWTPEQRARATKALAEYGRQLGAHQRIISGNQTLQQQREADLAAQKRQADTDAREQDRLDRAAKAKAAAKKIHKGSGGGTKLKDYQTSTKI